MTGPEPVRPEPGPDAGVDDLQADIVQTRQELGETVEALTAKLDVKERTKQKAVETKERATQKAAETKARVVDKAHSVQHAARDNPEKSVPVAAIVLICALAVGLLMWRRRR
jgi:hypothetical protein